MSPSQVLAIVLMCLPLAAVSLHCYTCVFPAINPMDCLKFPQECPVGQVCLSSTAVGVRGSLHLVLNEKSCAAASLCGQTGEKQAAGLNFTFTNDCCDTDLCNAGLATTAPWWKGVVLSLLSIYFALILG